MFTYLITISSVGTWVSTNASNSLNNQKEPKVETRKERQRQLKPTGNFIHFWNFIPLGFRPFSFSSVNLSRSKARRSIDLWPLEPSVVTQAPLRTTPCCALCARAVLDSVQGAQVHRPLTSGAVCGDASSFAHHPLLRSLRTGCAGQRSLVLFLLDFSFFGPLLSDWSTSSF